MQNRFPQLWFYDRLHLVSFPGSYIGKLMSICFVGTHIPLIAFIVFLGVEAQWEDRSLQIIGLILLVATLAGTALTMFAIHAMLSPLDLARTALANYREHGHLPRLPTHYGDAAGQVLREIEHTITRLHGALADLAHEARVDPLTGIANRRALMEHVRRIARESQGSGSSVCCAIVDVDTFKTLNDTYGHGVGDRVLVEVTKIMAAHVPAPGIVGRLGGDEFCILLPGGCLDTAGQTVEAIRQGVVDAKVAGLPKGTVSLSIGLVECREEELTVQTLLSRADTQLYRAKGAGRDRVSTAPSPPLLTQGDGGGSGDISGDVRL